MGAAKTSGGQGRADVAKLDFFGWEYKGKDADVDKAYEQRLRYRDALQHPPALVISDISHIVLRTNYTHLPYQGFLARYLLSRDLPDDVKQFLADLEK